MTDHVPEPHVGSTPIAKHVATPGDVLEAHGVPGAPNRRGVITEVLGEGVHRHYRVRWDEQHESLFFPTTEDGVRIVPKSSPE